MSRDRYSRPPYDPKLPPVHNSSTIPDSTSPRFPASPPVAVSFSQPPYDSPRQPADGGPRRESYEQRPRDTASNNPRPPYNDPRPPPNTTSTASNNPRPPYGDPRPPPNTTSTASNNPRPPYSDPRLPPNTISTASNNPRPPYSDPRPPPNTTSTGRQRRPSDAQWSPDNTVNSNQRQAPSAQQPPRDAGSTSHQRQPSDAQWSPVNKVSSNQQQPLVTQRPLHDTVSTSLRRQPSDAQWSLENTVGNQRSLRDIGPTSHQRQPSDAQWSADTSVSSSHRQPNTQRPQRDKASTSHHRQFSDPPHSDPPWFPDGGGGSNHPGLPGGARGGARSVDLTGQVQILTFPGKKYQWLIGAGAFTDVFKGEYRRVTAPGTTEARPVFVAVKIFRSACDDQQQREDVSRRLIRESSVWLRLDHPNIQPYLGHCSDLGLSVALISPLCGNSTVMKYIAINPSSNKRQLVKDVIKGLDYLHSKDVIHGDLQCNNVLVDEAGRARLTDFGRAKVIGEAGYSTQMLAGSAAYMAPELFPSTEVNVDNLFSKESDVYAFGILCFEIFTNQEPFACYNARLDWQVVPLIHQGKRPICSNHVQRQITQNDWTIMEACWTTMPANRLSAAQIMQTML